MSESNKTPKEETGKDLVIGLIKLIVPWALVLIALSFIV